MLDKVYLPSGIEQRIYTEWEESGEFSYGDKESTEFYSIVIPPPNVTGSLHMGHALNCTLQDILIRYRRMQGDNTLWQPGTDHAGIATQMVVERQLEGTGQNRHDLGRSKFIEKVWAWKEESGGRIIDQLRRLGASCDWSRERFTMDKGLSSAVTKVFVELYKDGLIYRDKRLVNWDPKLHTAISDLEVEQRESLGKLWYFKYPMEEDEAQFITVATTRPETMFGDVAVAVHPEDNRYKSLVGKFCRLPIVNRCIEIIADEYSDPEKGTGAVKITPAHDFNDFEVGKRHEFDPINIFDRNAHFNQNVPEKYIGMERFLAREKIIEEMDKLGFLEKVEDNEMTIPYGDRSGVIIEPWLTDQWFVDAKSMAASAVKVVKEGRIKFVPAHWDKTYFDWMDNIQPWCISRQIWWGHQIPAWFGPDGTVFVEISEGSALKAAEKHYGKKTDLIREEDVLDTWFSSALWPFSTLGWPENTSELEKFYPTNVLVTGFDIIFFWVARMIMMGMHFLEEVPFHTVYIHALVRDENGQKMSKSKGNIIDPLDLIEKFGADALRMTLAAHAAQGRDIKLSENRVEGYRNFATKLWNAARFCQMNECQFDPKFEALMCKLPVNQWIINKLAMAVQDVERGIEGYRFNEAANSIYQFSWGTFCDWYLEFAKPIFQTNDQNAMEETKNTTAWVLCNLIQLLHPFMPFITEELWNKITDSGGKLLIRTPWPTVLSERNEKSEAEIDWVVKLVSEVRSIRAEINLAAKLLIPLIVYNADEVVKSAIKQHDPIIKRLAGLSDISSSSGVIPKGSIQTVIGETILVFPLADLVDFSRERSRIEKEINSINQNIRNFEAKLKNRKFLSNAPEEVIQIQKDRLKEATNLKVKNVEALNRLKTPS